MKALVELNDKGKVQLTKFGLAVPELKKLRDSDHSAKGKDFESQITYLYFVHSKDSPYSTIIPLRERIKTVLKDKLPENKAEDFDKERVVEAIQKFIYLNYSIKERVLNQCRLKFGEFQVLWSDTTVGHENFEALSKEFNSANGLFATMDKLENQVRKEEELAEEETYGGHAPSMLEQGSLLKS